MQAVLLDLERVLCRLAINGIVKVHRRQVVLLALSIAEVADLRDNGRDKERVMSLQPRER